MPDWLTTITNIPMNDWTALGAFIAAGGGVSIITKVITHFRAPKWLHPTAMARFTVSAVSFLVAAANYILSTPNKSLTLILTHFGLLLSGAHIVYWISVSPFYKWLMGLLDDAAKWRQSTAPQSTAAAAGAEPPEEFAA